MAEFPGYAVINSLANFGSDIQGQSGSIWEVSPTAKVNAQHFRNILRSLVSGTIDTVDNDPEVPKVRKFQSCSDPHHHLSNRR